MGLRRFGWLALLVSVVGECCAQAPAGAMAGFDQYVRGVEARLARQHCCAEGFLALPADAGERKERLRRGELAIEELTPPGRVALPGALLHHWRGTAFVLGATTADFDHVMRDFNAYPRRFAPEVLRARTIAVEGDRIQASMRVQQKHILTVVMDTDYDVSFGRLDAGHGYSTSRSTRIAEIASPGTAGEHALSTAEEHGFLWRQNTYWSYEERDGGLYLQIESVSLSRSIPTGLGWIVRPLVESVPRESLEFTLRSTCKALRK